MFTYVITQGFMLENEKAIFTNKSECKIAHPELVLEMIESITPELPVDSSCTATEGMYLYEENFFVHYELSTHDEETSMWKKVRA